MIVIKRIACLINLLFFVSVAYSQTEPKNDSLFKVIVLNEKMQPADGATVELIKDSKSQKTVVVDGKGVAKFENIADGDYHFAVSYTGYEKQTTAVFHIPSTLDSARVILKPLKTTLQEVNVTAQRSFIEQKHGKTVLNVGSSITSVGSTVLEVLEKSPGVTVDKNGSIALKGKSGVLVMIDDKPTYLSPSDLNNLLSSMNSSQVDQIELITNPPAKYDASGNAGIINIKTKKNKASGFNGSFTTTLTEGVYPKNNESLLLNFRTGKINTFFNYNLLFVGYLTDIYALRKYHDENGAVTAQLKQPSYFAGNLTNNTIKTGLDYDITPKTTIGFVLGGNLTNRHGHNTGPAMWLDPSGTLDSTILTTNKSTTQFKNGSVNLNGRHHITSSQDISVDADWLRYDLRNLENFNNILEAPGGYNEASRGNIPSTINIFSGRADYSLKFAKDATFEAGAKTSHSSTDNLASYQNLINGLWVEDNSKNNHFLYRENIYAFYSDVEGKYGQVTAQAGLRYEHTNYNAHQLGNAIQKDSAFTNNYGGLFPSGYISYQADSSNNFTFTAGRRIDRPVYQTLNPFYFIINKYTFSTGDPFLLPQYSWNLELSHQYKNLLTTSVSYSIINNYFSQIFRADSSKDILLYTYGNVGHVYNLGLTASFSLAPCKWWSFTLQGVYNHKELVGFVGTKVTSYINQLNVSTTQQFTMAGIYTAELSGFYTGRARNDLQELLYPTGQLSLGLSRPVFNKRGTIKLSARDIFYTNAMEGLTSFPNATEYFKEKRDSRVISVSFVYRFGKTYKVSRHGESSAKDEMERVGNG